MKINNIHDEICNIDVNLDFSLSSNIKLQDLIKLDKGDMFIISDKNVKISYNNSVVGEGTLTSVGDSIGIVLNKIFSE